jgi:hypothetical protein
MWKNLANTPGRKANMASVHFDMQEKVPEIANAKINGYPSVIKVLPSGEVEEYTDSESGDKTNSIQTNIRDIETMKKEIRNAPESKRISASEIFDKEVKNAAAIAKEEEPGENNKGSNKKSKKSVKRAVGMQQGVRNTEDIFETNLRLASQRGGARRQAALAFTGGGLLDMLKESVSGIFGLGKTAESSNIKPVSQTNSSTTDEPVAGTTTETIVEPVNQTNESSTGASTAETQVEPVNQTTESSTESTTESTTESNVSNKMNNNKSNNKRNINKSNNQMPSLNELKTEEGNVSE